MMDTYKFYANPRNLSFGLTSGGVLMVFGASLVGNGLVGHAGPGAIFVGCLSLVFALFVLPRVGFTLCKCAPVIVANASGLSLMGKQPIPWRDVRKVEAKRMRVGVLTLAPSVRVSIVGAPHKDIPWFLLPWSSRETADTLSQLVAIAAQEHLAAERNRGRALDRGVTSASYPAGAGTTQDHDQQDAGMTPAKCGPRLFGHRTT